METSELKKVLRQAKYELSTQNINKLPEDQGQEWAFMGRSNAGKSSLLNSLTGSKIAKTSKTPGRTQCMNVFSLNQYARLVDFPGYGFAKVNKKQQDIWQAMIGNYLHYRNCLSGICIITDIRHVGIKTDLDFFNLACAYEVPILIVLNKSDKLSKNKIANAKKDMQNIIKVFNHKHISIQEYSAFNNTGNEQLIQWLSQCAIPS